MYCPRCGTEYEAGDRFCSSCGTTLGRAAEKGSEVRSLGERAAGLLGTTRQARLVTLGTVAAIAIAIGAFVALKPADDDSIPRDAYTITADRMCLDAKRQIVAAERTNAGDSGRLARALVPIVASWRSGFRALRVPGDRLERARRLDAALRDVEIETAGLALTAEEGSRSRTLARAKKVDLATTHVEQSISDLGLGQCARARIGLSTGNTG